MATIKKTIDLSEELTEKQLQMLKEAEEKPYQYDPDNPPITEEELAQFSRVSDLIRDEKMNRRKQNVTLRLSPATINKAKALGKGYSSILSRIIEKALDDPKIVESLLK